MCIPRQSALHAIVSVAPWSGHFSHEEGFVDCVRLRIEVLLFRLYLGYSGSEPAPQIRSELEHPLLDISSM